MALPPALIVLSALSLAFAAAFLLAAAWHGFHCERHRQPGNRQRGDRQ